MGVFQKRRDRTPPAFALPLEGSGNRSSLPIHWVPSYSNPHSHVGLHETTAVLVACAGGPRGGRWTTRNVHVGVSRLGTRRRLRLRMLGERGVGRPRGVWPWGKNERVIYIQQLKL